MPASHTDPASLHDALPIFDVPGHERFIRNMLAGAHGMDLVLFTVAADDGVMPQTEEHLDILHLLGLRHHPVVRSEEHTSELQSRFDLVCRPLLGKKKCDSS